MALSERTIDEIADLLKDTQTQDTKACLLIGAGVSYSAGIGLAGDFVKRIQEDYPAIYARACASCTDAVIPGYAQCMAALPPAKQVQLVRADIDSAKTNWAHIGIARMERGGVVDTILTPNFDPLASRACALFNRFPAIYDLAGLRDGNSNGIDFERSFVKGSAIFHLHGQHTGFLLLNTTEKLNEQARRIRPVLDAVMRGKPVIIAGYSGENDPLIDQIAALAPFNHGLYWVCHDNNDPAAAVCEKLLCLADCHVVRNMPADKFFTELANALKLQAPGFLASPFAHMTEVLNTLRPFTDVGENIGDDLLQQAKNQLLQADERQKVSRPDQINISTLSSTGQYQQILDQYQEKAKSLPDDDRDLVVWAGIMLGNDLSEQAKTKEGAEADGLFAQAGEKYAAALVIKPDKHEALNNWGNAIAAQAKTKKGAEADGLFAQAGEKYAAALVIKPDKHDALYNWGVSLSDQAKTKEGAEADGLFAQAGEKYAAALMIAPGKHEALNNWGATLSDQAKTKEGADADALVEQAAAKLAAADALLTGAASYNLACLYATQRQPELAASWLRASCEHEIDFPGCRHIAEDSDFDKIRDAPEFVAVLAEIGC